MRFKKWPRFAFADTSRKRAALRRKQRKEREAMPLLADLVAEDQPGEDEVMEARARAWAEAEIRDRNRRADKWRAARRRLAALSGNEQSVLRHAWNCAPYPADPVYLLDFLHGYAVGRITLDKLAAYQSPTDAHGCRIDNPGQKESA